MSLFQAPLLKSELVNFAGTDFELFELSAFDRCEYLEKTTESIPAPKGDEELPLREIKFVGEIWSIRREDVSAKLLLIAYALKPGRDESLDELHAELRRNVVPNVIDELYIPAAKLSNLYIEPPASNVEEEGAEDESAEDEGSEKKG